MTPMTFWKNFLELIETIVTSGGIILAGVWTYFLFIKNRLRYPKAKLSHEVVKKDLGIGKSLIHVTLTVSNSGGVLLPIRSAQTWISQVFPLTEDFAEILRNGQPLPYDKEAEIEWPHLETRTINYREGSAEIEPGESERFHFEFLVSSELEAIKIYSHFPNERKKKAPIGWSLTSIFDMTKGVLYGNQATPPKSPSTVTQTALEDPGSP